MIVLRVFAVDDEALVAIAAVDMALVADLEDHGLRVVGTAGEDPAGEPPASPTDPKDTP